MARGANRKEKVFAMYRGDEFIAVGTYKEISKATGKSINCLRSLKSRQDEYPLLVFIELDDLEDEELEVQDERTHTDKSIN